MSKTALLALNDKTQRWEATYGGRVLVSSPNKKYVGDVITKGLNQKAAALGVTKVEELGGTHTGEDAVPLIEFNVNERFQFLEDTIDMVAARQMKSAVVVGEGGLGKSYTVFDRIKRAGMTDIHKMDPGSFLDESNSRSTFITMKGHQSPKNMYRTLYENRGRLVIFDDCDSVLFEEKSANVLKAALDSYDERWVNWGVENNDEDGLPNRFLFTGGVIFISNKPMHKMPQAILSRSACADVSMTRTEIVQRMRQIVAKGEFLEDEKMSIKNEALDFIAEHATNHQIKAINLRTLITVVTNRRCMPERWKRLSLSMMIAAR